MNITKTTSAHVPQITPNWGQHRSSLDYISDFLADRSSMGHGAAEPRGCGRGSPAGDAPGRAPAPSGCPQPSPGHNSGECAWKSPRSVWVSPEPSPGHGHSRRTGMLVSTRNSARERGKITKGNSWEPIPALPLCRLLRKRSRRLYAQSLPKNRIRISAQPEEKQGSSHPPRPAPASSRPSLGKDSQRSKRPGIPEGAAAPGALPLPAPLRSGGGAAGKVSAQHAP